MNSNRDTENNHINSILETFKREKNTFNQKFQELKNKLEQLNSNSYNDY